MLSYSKTQAFLVFLKWMACFFVLNQIVGGIFVAAKAVRIIRAGGEVSLSALMTVGSSPWIVVIGNSLAWFAFLFWEMKSRRLAWRDVLVLNARPFMRFVPVILFGVGAIALINEVDYFFNLMCPMPDLFKQMFGELLNFGAQPVGTVLALAVVAPVTEEFLFRGILLRGLLNRISPRAAVVFTAFLFAVMHLNPWQAVSAFLIGLVFGWIYMRTRSVALCMVVHAINNVAGLYYVNLIKQGESDGVFWSPENPWWLNVTGVVLLAGGAAWLRFLTRAGPPADELAIARPPPLPAG